MKLIVKENLIIQNSVLWWRQLIYMFLINLLLVMFSTAEAQETISVQQSLLTGTRLSPKAARIVDGHVPAEINDVMKNLIAAGGNNIRQGETEVLVWNEKDKKIDASVIIRVVIANVQSAGWKYETGGEDGGLTFLSVSRNTPKKQVIIGFYKFSDDALVWAWTEMLAANQSVIKNEVPKNSGNAITNSVTEKIITVDKSTQHINVMGNEMPAIPVFQKLSPKPGKVCGYVKDLAGKPLAGATIGVRSSYFAGYYSGGKAKTDANGYYELTPPKGSAHFYNAGYQLQYGEGVAALSLHPADGTLESWTTVDGVVENFVLLPYGITSRENVQNNPQLPAGYYGGAIFLGWYGVEANDDNAPEFAIKEGTLIEITLTPEGKTLNGAAAHSFVIRKVAGSYGELRIHNIPLGLYRISIKANGKAVKIKDTRKYNPLFGLNPAEAVGAANIAFLPGTADASMITPQYGAWEWVNLNLESVP